MIFALAVGHKKSIDIHGQPLEWAASAMSEARLFQLVPVSGKLINQASANWCLQLAGCVIVRANFKELTDIANGTPTNKTAFIYIKATGPRPCVWHTKRSLCAPTLRPLVPIATQVPFLSP